MVLVNWLRSNAMIKLSNANKYSKQSYSDGVCTIDRLKKKILKDKKNGNNYLNSKNILVYNMIQI